MSKDYSFKTQIGQDQNVTIEITVNGDKFKQVKEKTFATLSKEVHIQGFRKGHAPKALVESKLGPDLFEKTLNKLLPEITVAVLEEEKLDPITQVKYEVKKVSDEGVEYSASFVRYPEIKLANFKKIKPQELKYAVDDKEVAEEVSRILKMYQQQNKDNDNGKVLVMTDEIVQSLKIGLKTKAELEDMLRKQLEHNKKHAAENEQMADIVKQAIELSSIDAPKQLVEAEVLRREADYTSRIEQLGLKLDDFLKSQKTTLDDLKQGWTRESQERIKSELLLAQIAREQKLTVANEEVEKELNSMTDSKLKEQYDNFEGRRYITSLLLQQKSLQWLRSEVGIAEIN